MIDFYSDTLKNIIYFGEFCKNNYIILNEKKFEFIKQ